MRPLLRSRLFAQPKPTSHAPIRQSRYFSISSSRSGPFTNKNCLITGGSSGIGRAIAIEFARLGANITIIGRNTDRLAETLNECDKARGEDKESILSYTQGSVEDAHFWHLLSSNRLTLRRFDDEAPASAHVDVVKAEEQQQNVDSLDRIDDMMDTSRNREIKSTAVPPPTETRDLYTSNVDILVNCAGLNHEALLIRQSTSQIEEIMHTNLLGPTFAIKHLGKNMIKRSKEQTQTDPVNCIINISSMLAVRGGTGAAAYAASKAGVIGLTRALAGEFGPLGVRVNAILPGYIRTKMTENMPEQARANAEKKIPLRRFGEPHEIAQAAVFLAQNQYANGCIMNLDGGIGAEV